jgi:hypothetical protein
MTINTTTTPAERTWPGRPGDAARLAESMQLPEPARAALDPSQDIAQFVAALRSRDCVVEALGVLARWLPRRDGVRWACQCVGESLAAEDLQSQAATLETAQRWAADPSEKNRRAAGKAAETGHYETPAALAALASFWSEGSMSPEHAPAVPAPPHLAPEMMVNAMRLAAVRTEPQKAPLRLARFLEIGLATAQGKAPATESPRG